MPSREYATIETRDSREKASAALQRALGRGVITCSENDASTFIRNRGRSGAWGSIVFHGGLLVILIGLYISHMGSVSQILSLTEGEWSTLSSTESTLMSTAALLSVSTSASPIRIQLQRLEYDHTVGGTETSASHLAAEIADERHEAVARVNQSMSVGDWTVHHAGTWGYAPELVILGPADSVLFRGSIRLSTTSTERGAFRDSVRIAALTHTIQLHLFPDFVRVHGGDSSRTKWPRNPVLFIAMHDEAGSSTAIPLALGQHAEAGDVRFVFPRLYRWSQLDAVRDPGLNFLLYGCIISVFGLFLRITRTEKTIGARLTGHGEGSKISLLGRTEKYPCSFRHEMKQMEKRISAELRDE